MTGPERPKRMAPKARYRNDAIVSLSLALAEKARAKRDLLDIGVSWASQRSNSKEVYVDNIAYF